MKEELNQESGKKISSGVVKRLIEEGLSDMEIARKLKVPAREITGLRRVFKKIREAEQDRVEKIEASKVNKKNKRSSRKHTKEEVERIAEMAVTFVNIVDEIAKFIDGTDAIEVRKKIFQLLKEKQEEDVETSEKCYG